VAGVVATALNEHSFSGRNATSRPAIQPIVAVVAVMTVVVVVIVAVVVVIVAVLGVSAPAPTHSTDPESCAGPLFRP
jgi:hypothetical protein